MSLEEIREKVDQLSVPEEESDLGQKGVNELEEEVKGTDEPEKPEEEAEEEVKTDTEEEAKEPSVEKDPPRVPYSRFELVNEARIIAEQKLKQYEENIERERLAKASTVDEAGVPDYWKQLYGDSDESKMAYKLRQQELADMRDSLRDEVRQSIVNEQKVSEQMTEDMVDDWQTQFEDYAKSAGRKLTESQQDAILDVMDELTPKDAEGNYLVEPIDYLERAVELYDLRTEKALSAKKASKKATAQITEAKSEGSSLNGSPKDWDGNWEKKLSKMGL